MTLRLRIAGPGLDVVRVLELGEPPLVLGRDADCGVCLPDPQRNVSRRHLQVSNEGGELVFQVLSVVNGVELPAGTVPPGGRGVLQPGEALRLGDQEMLETLYHLARTDALVVGTSSALNVRAAYEIARQHRGEGLRIVTFLCDHGLRYASKVFNPEFLKQKGLEPRPLE